MQKRILISSLLCLTYFSTQPMKQEPHPLDDGNFEQHERRIKEAEKADREKLDGKIQNLLNFKDGINTALTKKMKYPNDPNNNAIFAGFKNNFDLLTQSKLFKHYYPNLGHLPPKTKAAELLKLYVKVDSYRLNSADEFANEDPDRPLNLNDLSSTKTFFSSSEDESNSSSEPYNESKDEQYEKEYPPLVTQQKKRILTNTKLNIINTIKKLNNSRKEIEKIITKKMYHPYSKQNNKQFANFLKQLNILTNKQEFKNLYPKWQSAQSEREIAKLMWLHERLKTRNALSEPIRLNKWCKNPFETEQEQSETKRTWRQLLVLSGFTSSSDEESESTSDSDDSFDDSYGYKQKLGRYSDNGKRIPHVSEWTSSDEESDSECDEEEMTQPLREQFNQFKNNKGGLLTFANNWFDTDYDNEWNKHKDKSLELLTKKA